MKAPLYLYDDNEDYFGKFGQTPKTQRHLLCKIICISGVDMMLTLTPGDGEMSVRHPGPGHNTGALVSTELAPCYVLRNL